MALRAATQPHVFISAHLMGVWNIYVSHVSLRERGQLASIWHLSWAKSALMSQEACGWERCMVTLAALTASALHLLIPYYTILKVTCIVTVYWHPEGTHLNYCCVCYCLSCKTICLICMYSSVGFTHESLWMSPKYLPIYCTVQYIY